MATGKSKETKKLSTLDQQIVDTIASDPSVITATDVADRLKELFGPVIKQLLEAELDEHLGYERSQRSDSKNARNGYKSKSLRTSAGDIQIETPQDRLSTFDPKIVPKHKRDITDIEDKIITLYTNGMTTREISKILYDLYGFEVSDGFVSDVTDRVWPLIEEWQARPLASVYPVVYIDCVYFSVRDSGHVSKKAVYVVLGIDTDGRKDVLSLHISETESAKFWLGVFNDLQNRGVKDIFFVCADGLSGIKDAIEAAFPKAEYQRCIVHMVRNTLKHVSYKDMKAFAADLKTIYNASSLSNAEAALDRANSTWSEKYPHAMERWYKNWGAITPIFNFKPSIRKVIYTTNAIESLNSTYKSKNSKRSVFPSDKALLKTMWLITRDVTKKWTMPIKNWSAVYSELYTHFKDRLPSEVS